MDDIDFDGINQEVTKYRERIALYATDWKATGAIIEDEGICLVKHVDSKQWKAYYETLTWSVAWGPSPLIAACRCYIAHQKVYYGIK